MCGAAARVRLHADMNANHSAQEASRCHGLIIRSLRSVSGDARWRDTDATLQAERAMTPVHANTPRPLSLSQTGNRCNERPQATQGETIMQKRLGRWLACGGVLHLCEQRLLLLARDFHHVRARDTVDEVLRDER